MPRPRGRQELGVFKEQQQASVTGVRSAKGRILSVRIASQLGVLEQVTQPFCALIASSWLHKVDFDCPGT